MVQLWARTIAETLVGEYKQAFHARKSPFHNMHVFPLFLHQQEKFSKWSFFTLQSNIQHTQKKLEARDMFILMYDTSKSLAFWVNFHTLEISARKLENKSRNLWHAVNDLLPVL